MTTNQKIGCLTVVLSGITTTPIWYYILYQVLSAIHASELTWFLFWVYVPFSFILGIANGLILNVLKEK